MDRQAWQGGHQEFANGLESMSHNWEGGATGQTWGSICNDNDANDGTMDSNENGGFGNGSQDNFQGGHHRDSEPVEVNRKKNSRKVTVGSNLRAEQQAQSELEALTPSNKSPSPSPLKWDPKRVGQWLEELGLPAQAFVDSGVTGEDLFALSKGENSACGIEAMNKLRPFLARRVIYEADRLMSMILERSSVDKQPTFNPPTSGSLETTPSPINGYVNHRTIRHDSLDDNETRGTVFGRDRIRSKSDQPSPSMVKGVNPKITPIRTLPKKNSLSKMDVGIYEPPQPMEPPPPLHGQDDDDDNASNATISSENSEDGDEVNEIRESFEYKQDFDETASDTGSSEAATSVQSIASPAGSLNMDTTSPFYQGGGTKQLESHLDRLNRSRHTHEPYEPHAEPKTLPRQFGVGHKSTSNDNGPSRNGSNSMAVLKASTVEVKEVAPKPHKHHHHHKHRGSVNTKRNVSFQTGHKEVDDSPRLDSWHNDDGYEETALPKSKKLSLYKMSELINKSFPSPKKGKSKNRSVSFGGKQEMTHVDYGEMDSDLVNLTATLDSLDTMDSLGTMDTVGSIESQNVMSPSYSLDSGSDPPTPTEIEFHQPVPRERKLSLYRMSEFISNSFGDSNNTTPRSRAIKMKKVQSKKFDDTDDMSEPKLTSRNSSSSRNLDSDSAARIDRHSGQRKSSDSDTALTPVSKMTARNIGQRKSVDNDAGLTPLLSKITSGRQYSKEMDDQQPSRINSRTRSNESATTMPVSRHSVRIQSNDSSTQPLTPPPVVSPVKTEVSRKKNRSLKFNVEKNDNVEVEKEMKMKAGRKIKASSTVEAKTTQEVPVEVKKKKCRGISRIILASEDEVSPAVVAGGNDSSSEGVCISGGGGRSSGGGDSKLRPLGGAKQDSKMLQTPKKKKKENGDFNEEGEFKFGEWTIDADGIQSMPADRSDVSTARAQHGQTSSGRNTPHSSRGHHSDSHNSSHGFTPSPIGYDLFHPSSTLNDSLLSLQGQGHYLAQPSRKPNLSSILSEGMNPLDRAKHATPLGQLKPRHSHCDPQPPLSSEEVPTSAHKHKHKHREHRHHRHSHETNDTMSSTSDDHNGSDNGVFGSMRDSNATWRSQESRNKSKQEMSIDTDDMVNQGSLNNSLRSTHNFADSMRSENSNFGNESHDDVLMSSLKFDKSAMPQGGAGGDFEAQHKGFRPGGGEEDNQTSVGFRPMNGNLMNPPSARATTPNTPRKTKINLVKLEELGRGAGGVVYKAVHVPTMTIVAVKHIFVEDDAKRRQMQRELNLLHAFNSKPLQQRHDLGKIAHLGRQHPINLLQGNPQEKKEEVEVEEGFGSHVVSIYDAYSDKADRSVCLVLEYMSGGSLESFVKEHRRLTEAQIAHIARCCFLALSDLKKRRLLHRDIKPANILIDHLGNVKLSDFGIMKEFEEDSLSKTFTGTLAYMSPERILCGSGQSDEGYSYPADIWGVGLSLLALGLGKEPFPLVRSIWDVLSVTDETKNAVPSLRNQDNFANLTKINSSNPSDYQYSADLCDMVDCCLRRDAKLRLTADELLKHPFFDKYPACQNTAGLLASEKTVRIFGSALREQEEKGGAEDFPFEPPPPPLFGMFVTPEAAATRMLVALIKSLNPTTTGGLGETSANNSARGGMSHGNDRSKKFNGLTLEILRRLRSQLPGVDESRFQQLHDRALKGLEGDERRKSLMSWVNKRTK